MNIHRKMCEINQLVRLYMRLKLSLDLLKFRIISKALPGYEECFRVCFNLPMTTCMPSGVHIRWPEKKPLNSRFDTRRRSEFLNGRPRGRRANVKRGGRYARRKA